LATAIDGRDMPYKTEAARRRPDAAGVRRVGRPDPPYFGSHSAANDEDNHHSGYVAVPVPVWSASDYDASIRLQGDGPHGLPAPDWSAPNVVSARAEHGETRLKRGQPCVARRHRAAFHDATRQQWKVTKRPRLARLERANSWACNRMATGDCRIPEQPSFTRGGVPTLSRLVSNYCRS